MPREWRLWVCTQCTRPHLQLFVVNLSRMHNVYKYNVGRVNDNEKFPLHSRPTPTIQHHATSAPFVFCIICISSAPQLLEIGEKLMWSSSSWFEWVDQSINILSGEQIHWFWVQFDSCLIFFLALRFCDISSRTWIAKKISFVFPGIRCWNCIIPTTSLFSYLDFLLFIQVKFEFIFLNSKFKHSHFGRNHIESCWKLKRNKVSLEPKMSKRAAQLSGVGGERGGG